MKPGKQQRSALNTQSAEASENCVTKELQRYDEYRPPDSLINFLDTL